MRIAQKQTGNGSGSPATKATDNSWKNQSAQALYNGKATTTRTAVIDNIDNSPRMSAQRRRIEGYLGVDRTQSDKFIAPAARQPIQRLAPPDAEASLQGKFASKAPAQLQQQTSPKPNNSGLPDNLKNGIEALSGLSMDHVKVHYNSSQPAQLNALAYAQGSDIHVAPGQERHLPHEAWHVVQQAQGRVQPTIQAKGTPINDDRGLEQEADTMGSRAMQMLATPAAQRKCAACEEEDKKIQRKPITASNPTFIQAKGADNPKSSGIIQKQDAKTCPVKFSKATSFKGLVKLVEEAEKQLVNCGYKTIEERLHIIRGLYYGTTWSVDYDVEKSPVRNLAFNIPYTGSTEPDDPRNCLDCSLVDALKKSAEVTDGKKSFDFGHAIIGMDARRSVVARNISIPTQGGTGLDIVTWLGDLGGGAGMLSIRRMTDPAKRVKSVFSGSDFGGAVNLEGDIGAFLIARNTAKSGISGLDFSGKTFLWEALDTYLDPAASGSEWNNRCQLFLIMLGGVFAGKVLSNRSSLETTLAAKIKGFGLWYLVNRLRQSGTFSKKTATDASKHLIGASTEVAGMFLDILTSCASGTATLLKPTTDPNPTPPGNALSEVESLFSTKEKAEGIIKDTGDALDSAKKWLEKQL